MKNHGNTVSHHEHNNYPETKLKVIADYDLIGGEFKRAIMRKFNELQDNSGIKVINRRTILPRTLTFQERIKPKSWS